MNNRLEIYGLALHFLAFCPKRQWYQQVSPSRWYRSREHECDDECERWCGLELLRWSGVPKFIFMTASSASTFVSMDSSWSILVVEPGLIESSFCSAHMELHGAGGVRITLERRKRVDTVYTLITHHL
ncbi:hypothetical protein Zmor_014731 [Zophobas morio]|uniref:Uncharacterized protein n=1 Tax=Zophobas morio TaxID=2755281 RepID=A0AA38IIN1_9CUCU|nr:hypothetical protein Zmor_023795 [Zophobas morio]KAJ3655609.1 hypothetical protein Zmor_014731 [Zophobas morio]